MAVSLETERKPDLISPTALNLLHFRTPSLDGARINGFRETLTASAALERQCQRTGTFLQNLFSETEKKSQRINGFEQEIIKQGSHLVSSEHFANRYLKMREAFPQMSFADFIIAFKESWRVMLAISGILGSSATGVDQSKALLALAPDSKTSQGINTVAYKALEKAPNGFAQGLALWKTFFIHPDNFIGGIEPSRKSKDQKHHSQKADMEFLIPSGIPDWFSEDMREEPDTAMITREMEEDKEGAESIDKQLGLTYQQKVLIANITVEKLEEALKWIAARKKYIFGDFDAPKIILLLHFTAHAQNRITEATKGIKTNFIKNYNSLTETADKQIEQQIKAYSESRDALETPESYALFLEKQLSDAGVTVSGGLIDDNFIKFINDAIMSEKETVRKLLPRKSANAITYGIQPLMSVLDKDEIDYIQT